MLNISCMKVPAVHATPARVETSEALRRYSILSPDPIECADGCWIHGRLYLPCNRGNLHASIRCVHATGKASVPLKLLETHLIGAVR